MSPDIAVVGGGVIGLAIAWRAAEAGLGRVTVFDPELAHSSPGQSSWAAAGMLAPVTEVHYGEEALLALTLASRDRWPAFADSVHQAGGVDPGYRTEGTLSVARDGDDLARLEEIAVFQAKLGLDVTRLRAREVRDLEPALSPRTRAGFLVTGDHSVDNRALVLGLRAACTRAGVTLTAERVASTADLAGLSAGVVVIAAGAASGQLVPGLTVRPVKGQLLHLRGAALLTRTVRGIDAYLVPRADGRLVVGATVEEKGGDVSVTAGAVHELLRAAYELVPGMTELTFSEAVVGQRPGTADNAPLLGRVAERTVVATGHYRNGILLTPVTADIVVELLSTGRLPKLAVPFSPDRFA